jgi:predicted alpha/beta superfamily hydrolase
MNFPRTAKEQGRIHLHPRFPSRYLSTPRDLIVYLPPGYDGNAVRRYPVLYLQDGQNLFDGATAFAGQEWRADETADRLISYGCVEPLIIVGIYNIGVRRVSEYTPTRDPRSRKGGKAERYAQMLANDVKPFIDGMYRTQKGALHTGAGGSSLGALVSLTAGLRYPKVFGRLALLSPSVWWDHRAILASVAGYQTPARPRIWLDTGTAEGGSPDRVVADARLLRDTLLEHGWREGETLCYFEDEGAMHHESAWGARLAGALEFLFPAQDAR